LEDLQARLEKLLIDAEDCALIGKLATNVRKRDLFHRLATDLRGMACDVQAMIEVAGRSKWQKHGAILPKGWTSVGVIPPQTTPLRFQLR
jgi:hypothetical protein